MRRAAQAFVVTVLVVVAGIWLRELGPPLDGGERLWSNRDPLLHGVDSLVLEGSRHSVVRAGDAAPVVLDRRDGSVHGLRGTRVLGIAADGTAVSTAEGRLYGDRRSGPAWAERVGPLLDGRTPAYLGSDGQVLAVGGCRAGEGVVLGVGLADAARRWRVAGPCPVEQPDAGSRYFVTTRPAQAFADGPALDAFVHQVADGRRVADLRRVRAVHLVGDDLLVLDAGHQLFAQRGGERRWLLDPATAALADAQATGLAVGFPGAPAVVFADRTRALVDPTTGTLRRQQEWGAGPLARSADQPAVAHGREFAWDGRRLVVRNVFTGRELWRAELPDGGATATLTDPALVVVAVDRDDGRHQSFAYDALTGEQLARTRPAEETWRLLPAGDRTLLASDGRRHHLLSFG